MRSWEKGKQGKSEYPPEFPSELLPAGKMMWAEVQLRKENLEESCQDQLGWEPAWATWSSEWYPCPQQGLGTRWCLRSFQLKTFWDSMKEDTRLKHNHWSHFSRQITPRSLVLITACTLHRIPIPTLVSGLLWTHLCLPGMLWLQPLEPHGA